MLEQELRKVAHALSVEPQGDSGDRAVCQEKLASVYANLVYSALVEGELAKRAASDSMPEDIGHPFRHYWTNRLGGAALGGALGAMAGSGGSPKKQIAAALAGAFVGERTGEAKAIVDHYRTVNSLDEMGITMPVAVRHPHYYGLGSHQEAMRSMQPAAPAPLYLTAGS